MKLEPGRYVVRGAGGAGGYEVMIEVFCYAGEEWWHYVSESRVHGPGTTPTIIGRVDDEVLSKPVENTSWQGLVTACQLAYDLLRHHHDGKEAAVYRELQSALAAWDASTRTPVAAVAVNGSRPAAGFSRYAVSWRDGHHCFIDAELADDACAIAIEKHGTPPDRVVHVG